MVIERYEDLVGHIAYEFSRRFHMVESADIRQELWLWFLQHPKKLKHWETEYDDKNSIKLIAKSLRNAAKDYCQREKAKALGYRVEDNYYYDKQLLEAILPGVFSGSRTPPSLTDMGYSNTKKVLSEGNNWLAMCADVEKCLKKISDDQYLILSYRFYEGFEITKIAEDLSVSQDAARMRINRALNSLLNMLGGNRPRREKDYIETEEDPAAKVVNDSNVWEIPTQTFSTGEGEENDL